VSSTFRLSDLALSFLQSSPFLLKIDTSISVSDAWKVRSSIFHAKTDSGTTKADNPSSFPSDFHPTPRLESSSLPNSKDPEVEPEEIETWTRAAKGCPSVYIFPSLSFH